MKLRPYQENAIVEVLNTWQGGKQKILLVKPTGAGKTVTFTQIAKNEYERGGKVLIMSNRVELISQTANTFIRSGLTPSILTADKSSYNNPRLFIGMIETLKSRLHGAKYQYLLKGTSLIIIDECHYGNFFALFEEDFFQKAKILGVTATPISANKEKPLKNYYDTMIEPVSIAELIENGFLVPAKYYADEQDLSALKIKNGEYSDESQMEVFHNDKMYNNVVENYIKFSTGKKAICFNANTKITVQMTEEFCKHGIKAEYLISGNESIAGTTDQDRKRILADFKSGKIDVICNTAILTAGFDEPSCETIILNFATTGLSKYVQCVGRGARPDPNNAGKTAFNVIDMGQNFLRHGFFGKLWIKKNKRIVYLDTWLPIFENPKFGKQIENKEGKFKECPKCNNEVPDNTETCYHTVIDYTLNGIVENPCGYLFPKVKKEKKEKEYHKGNFVEIGSDFLTSLPQVPDFIRYKAISEMTIPELIQYQSYKNYKHGWVLWQLKHRGQTAIEEFAKLKKYNSGWINQFMITSKTQLWKEITEAYPKQEANSIAEVVRNTIEEKKDFFIAEMAIREKYLNNKPSTNS